MGLLMVPADDALKVAAAVGRGLYRVDRRHRRRAAANIARSFPEWSAERVQEVTRGCFEHLVQLAVEVLQTPRLLQPDTWAQRIQLGRIAPAIRLLNSGQPAILVTGHVGNWEVLGYLLTLLGYRIHAVARPLDNPFIDRWLLGIRQAKGLSIIAKFDATEPMLEVLEQGGLLGFIADQNAGDHGIFVPFFGKLASTYKSIGLLAILRRIPIICGYARRVGPGARYEFDCVDVIYPEDWESRRDPLFYVTARYMYAIERMIRAAPEQYLWMHRRWKSRPRWEREGRTIPASVQRNLQELPWVDGPMLERLQQPIPPQELRL